MGDFVLVAVRLEGHFSPPWTVVAGVLNFREAMMKSLEPPWGSSAKAGRSEAAIPPRDAWDLVRFFCRYRTWLSFAVEGRRPIVRFRSMNQAIAHRLLREMAAPPTVT
jgi:hypothetical protein